MGKEEARQTDGLSQRHVSAPSACGPFDPMRSSGGDCNKCRKSYSGARAKVTASECVQTMS